MVIDFIVLLMTNVLKRSTPIWWFILVALFLLVLVAAITKICVAVCDEVIKYIPKERIQDVLTIFTYAWVLIVFGFCFGIIETTMDHNLLKFWLLGEW